MEICILRHNYHDPICITKKDYWHRVKCMECENAHLSDDICLEDTQKL